MIRAWTTGWLFWVGLIHWTSPVWGCSAQLDSKYGVRNSSALYLSDSNVPTLNAELGSVGSRYPAVIFELRRLIQDFHDDPVATLNHMPDRLDALMKLSPDERWRGPLLRVASTTRRTRQIVQTASSEIFEVRKLWPAVEANLWELLVASLLAGHRFEMNAQLVDLYPGIFGSDYRREIDVVIERPDGSWRWIEVKNWSPANANQTDKQDALIKQARRTALARRALAPRRISRELVMRHGLSVDDYLRIKERGEFDRVSFIFPGPLADLTRSEADAR